MRLDVRKEPRDPRCEYAIIYLDGKRVLNATVADEEGGYIERNLVEEYKPGDDCIRTERKCGKVKIEWRKDMPHWFRRD